MSNKIIDEQRWARNEFIKLKQMQKGEISAESKSEEIVPKTFQEKLQNFWYHFKWQTIFSVFLIGVIAVCVTQCASREKQDMFVVFLSYSQVLDAQIEKVEEYIEQYATDIDGNGKVAVQVVNCSFNQKSGNRQYTQAILQKLQSMIVSEPKAILFIVDEKGEEYINSISENGIFEKQSKLLDESFYIQCEGKEDYEVLPEDLMINYRRISETTMEKNEKAQEVYKAAQEVYNKIPTKKTVAN